MIVAEDYREGLADLGWQGKWATAMPALIIARSDYTLPTLITP
jgi:hypothetical protein